MNQPFPNIAARLIAGLRGHPLAVGIVLAALILALFLLRSHPQPKAIQLPKHDPLAASPLDQCTSPAVPSKITLSSGISDSLGYTGQLPLEARVRELMEITSPLTPSEIDESFRALLTLPAKGEALAQRSTWFHELANLLQRQKLDQRTFGEVLATVARNDARDLATRDYALQHLRRIWDKSAADKELRLAIEATFGEMAAPGNPLLPTALLSLHLIDPSGKGGTDSTILVRDVKAILEDSKTSGDEAVRARMVAARIAGERRIDGLRVPLLKLARAESEHTLVRMAAISALGRLADPSDINTLAAMSPSAERLKGAIRHAIATAAGK